MTVPPRVRYAPSPTGNLHIGSVRTALFNWLFARHHAGRFLVRLEDTDRERSKPEYERSIFEALEWLGLHHDEPIVRQSERIARHTEVAQALLARGAAYRCRCTPEELERMRSEQEARGERTRYDGRCRERSDIDPTAPHTVRLRLPLEGTVGYDDLVLGPQAISVTELDDYILLRADGNPTYNFVVAVDDHDMAITHVIRGMDHLTNTFKQLFVYDAMGWPRPFFAHTPNIHGKDGKKLSKRHGDTDVLEFRAAGFLPHALLNYVVRLGWGYGDQELFTLDEMIRAFTIEAVSRSPAIFDMEKLLWCNGEHLRSSPVAEVVRQWKPFLEAAGYDCADKDDTWLCKACETLRVRRRTLREMTEAGRFLFADPEGYDEKDCRKWWTPESLRPLEDTLAALQALPSVHWRAKEIHGVLQEVITRYGIGLNQLAQPIRVAVAGCAVSPPIDLSLELLGKSRTLERIERAIACIRDRQEP